MNLQETSKRFRLDDKNLETMLTLLDDLTNEIKTSKKRSIYHFKDIPIITIDGTEYELPVYIDPTFETFAGIGYDKDSPRGIDNVGLIVNPKFSASKKNLYNSLYHEFLHAVDPTITSKPSEKYLSKYDDPNERPDLYYSHGIELRGITGEFFEALTNEFRERLSNIKDNEDKEIYKNSLDNIVQFFNELEPLSPMSYDILDNMEGQRDFNNKSKQMLNKIMKDYPKTSELLRDTPYKEPYYLQVIDQIRVYSPKGWKMFLNMLYSTKEEILKMIEHKITEGLIQKILENKGSLSNSNKNEFAQFIRDLLKKIYKPMGNYFAKQDIDCSTSEGVWGVYPHSDTDDWSILNKFDTNSKVKDKMYELFLESNPESKNTHDFMNWIEQNAFDLFVEGGEYTDQLIDLNKGTIDRGFKNEDYAMSVIKEKYPESTLKRFCSGDIRDTKKGMDIEVTLNGKKFHVQVKPYIKIAKYIDEEDTIYYEVSSYYDSTKYGERNVQIIMFVNYDTKQYVMFNNKKSKIGEVRNNLTRFYESPLSTNMEFPLKNKRIFKSSISTQTHFGFNDKKIQLADLEAKKIKLEKLIFNIKKSIQDDNL
jgi:hypothetical protein